MLRNKKKILLALLIIFLLMQVIRIDKDNPSDDPTLDLVSQVEAPDEMKNLITIACYDCHSNSTIYPWYTNVAPVSWWVKGHINGARESMNFSKWFEYDEHQQKEALEACSKVLEETRMPPLSYMIGHKDAWLSDEQRTSLLTWFAQEAKKH